MRSHYCGDVAATDIGETVELTGWVHRRRDHGGVIFLDVRDRTGIVQVVYDPDTPESFEVADRVRSEFVLGIRGRVRPRPEGTVNPDMKTGEIEVLGHGLNVLNESLTPAFVLDEYSDAGEDVRLRYRFSTCAARRCRNVFGCAPRPLATFAGFWKARGSGTSRHRR